MDASVISVIHSLLYDQTLTNLAWIFWLNPEIATSLQLSIFNIYSVAIDPCTLYYRFLPISIIPALEVTFLFLYMLHSHQLSTMCKFYVLFSVL